VSRNPSPLMEYCCKWEEFSSTLQRNKLRIAAGMACSTASVP